MRFINKKIILKFLIVLGICLLLFFMSQVLKRPPVVADWQDHLRVASVAEFNENIVTIKNVRNFRYGPTEKDMHPDYYDKTYDLDDIKKVWFVAEPFNENQLAAHTFLSFEFNNGDFLPISIEARKTKDQAYSIWKGFLRTYPLIYIAADERDVVLLRANLRKDKVYVYPVKLTKPENAKLLLVDMLHTMNELTTTKPAWYNTFFANCTSSIAKHVNKIDKGRLSIFSWQLWFTASSDELALKAGLLDTTLSIDQAREKFIINTISEDWGDAPGYSKAIRGL